MMSMPAIQNMSTYPGQNFFEHVVVKTDPSVHSSDGDDDDKFVNHSVPFPWKLHEMLDAAEKESFTCVVSWLPDRQSFKVHQTESFVRGVMPTYFRQTKYKSFQRQLNMWGFERILAGPNKGGYSHVNFVRGQPALCRHMKRLKIKGNGNKRASSPSDSPSTTPTPLRVPPHRLVSSQVSDIMCQEKQRQQQQQQQRQNVYHRILMGMAAADISSSLWLALSTWPIPESSGILWASGNSRTCTFQGFFTQFGISSPLYNVSLSIYYLLVIRYSWREEQLRKVEPWLHALPLGWAGITAIAGLFLDLFHSANLWCWIAPNEDDTNRSSIYRWAFFYGPLWIAIIVVTIQLILVFAHVRTVTLRSERYTQHQFIQQRRAGEEEEQQQSSGPDMSIEDRISKMFHEDGDQGSSFQDSGVSSYNPEDSSNGALNNEHSQVENTHGGSIEDNTPGSSNQQHQPPPRRSLSSRLTPSSLRKSLLLAMTNNDNDTSTNTNTNNAATTRDEKRLQAQFSRRRRQVAMQCLRYACVFYLTWIPITMVRIWQTIDRRPTVFTLLLLAAMATPMQGLPNFCVYLYPTYLARRIRQQQQPQQRRRKGRGRPTGTEASRVQFQEQGISSRASLPKAVEEGTAPDESQQEKDDDDDIDDDDDASASSLSLCNNDPAIINLTEIPPPPAVRTTTIVDRIVLPSLDEGEDAASNS